MVLKKNNFEQQFIKPINDKFQKKLIQKIVQITFLMIWLILKISIQAFLEIDKISVKSGTDFFICTTNLNMSQWRVFAM